MLGVLFVGGEAPARSQEILGHVEKADFIVAADSGLTNAQPYTQAIDYLVGDLDSVSKKLLAQFPKEKILSYPKDKDFSDTELGIQKLIQLGSTNIIIVGGGGGRVDHFLANLNLLASYHQISQMYCSQSCLIKVTDSLSIKSQIGATISIFPLAEEPAQLGKTLGLHWDLTDQQISPKFSSLSNRFASEEISIEVKSGKILVITECGAGEELFNKK
ncbi:MAG: thiamine diphosphokinase [Spirochaetales bacterium]|nr:thiamine diphosphokinase [Spirochaetales bacterium]